MERNTHSDCAMCMTGKCSDQIHSLENEEQCNYRESEIYQFLL